MAANDTTLLLQEDLRAIERFFDDEASLLAAAIVVNEGFSSAGVKAILVALALLVTNPVLTHATARAARIRQFGEWTVQEAEEEGGPRP